MGEGMGPPTEGEPGTPRDEAPTPDDVAPAGELTPGGDEPANPEPSWSVVPPPARPASSLPESWSVGPQGPVDAVTPETVSAEPPKLQVGSVLGRTLDQFVSHPLEFVSLAIPAALISLLAVLVDVNQIGVSGQLAVTIVTTVAGIVFGLAMVVASDDVRGGRPIDLAAAIAIGLARTVTAIFSAVAVFLAACGAILVIVIVAVVLALVSFPLAVIAAIVGFVALGYVGIRWALSEVAIVLELQGPITAIGRSWSVTRGNALRMVALYLLLILLTTPIGIAVSLLALASPDVRIAGVLGALVALVTVPITSITSTIVFSDLSGRPFDAAANPPRPIGRIVLAGALIALGVIGVVLAAPNVGPALDRIASRSIPAADRGVIRFGTAANPNVPCRPLNQKTDFATTEEIYVGGYFTAVLPGGQSATESVYMNGNLLGSGPLTTTQAAACFSESRPLTGAPPGSYSVVVTYGGQTIASGTFTVH